MQRHKVELVQFHIFINKKMNSRMDNANQSRDKNRAQKHCNTGKLRANILPKKKKKWKEISPCIDRTLTILKIILTRLNMTRARDWGKDKKEVIRQQTRHLKPLMSDKPFPQKRETQDRKKKIKMTSRGIAPAGKVSKV